MGCLIRRLRGDDFPDLLRLYGLFHPEEHASDPHDKRLRTLWQKILADPAQRYYGAEEDGRLVSSCLVTVIPNLNHNGRPYALMENVVPDPAYRQRGLATRMIQHALSEAWRDDCYKVMLLTGRKEETILRFYEQAGFRPGVKTGFIAYPPSLKV